MSIYIPMRACIRAFNAHISTFILGITQSYADILVNKCIAAARRGCRETGIKNDKLFIIKGM